jgi:hypothetical protein
MSQEMPMVVTANVRVVEAPLVEPQVNHVVLAAPTQEQIEAANGVFSQNHEADLMAGLAGMWTGSLLLHGLVMDTVRQEEEEPDEEEEPKEKPE